MHTKFSTCDGIHKILITQTIFKLTANFTYLRFVRLLHVKLFSSSDVRVHCVTLPTYPSVDLLEIIFTAQEQTHSGLNKI